MVINDNTMSSVILQCQNLCIFVYLYNTWFASVVVLTKIVIKIDVILKNSSIKGKEEFKNGHELFLCIKSL